MTKTKDLISSFLIRKPTFVVRLHQQQHTSVDIKYVITQINKNRKIIIIKQFEIQKFRSAYVSDPGCCTNQTSFI